MPPRKGGNDIQENISASERQKQQQSRDGEEDIISSLPDKILHDILSFTDMKLAVQTSVLSRRWRNIWTSLRSLTFDADQFYSPTMNQLVGFSNFVDQVLILRDDSTTDVFTLICYYEDPEIMRRLNAWIIAVIRRGVQWMYLKVEVCGDVLRLPSCLFAYDSLKTLILVLRENKPHASLTLPDSMGLPELKYMLLHSLVFNDEKLTNKLFLSCPKLERLLLGDVEFRQINVDIFSHTLGVLDVINDTNDYGDPHWINSKFKLNAPSLKTLVFKDFMSRDYILENLTSLVEADIDMNVEQEIERFGVHLDPPAEKKQMYGQRMMKFLRALHKVKNLKLSAWFLEVISASPDLLYCQPTQFYSLKCLKLETWLSIGNIRAIAYLLQISPALESLFLEISKIKFGSSYIEDNLEAEVSFKCLLDNLVLIEIRDAIGCVNELQFLEILLKKAKVLKKLVVYITEEGSPNREEDMMKFTEKLSTFQKAFPDITISLF